MADTKKTFTSPVGRIVQGDLYEPNTTDIEGRPLTVKSGPNAGQSKVDYFFALAIPKGSENHWAETTWGAILWETGHTAFPQAATSPVFSWKVEDGDSQVPNGKGRKPCERIGYKGHWILKLGSDYAPTIYRQEGTALPVQVIEKDFIKPGYYVQVVITPKGNGSDLKPGIKLYHSMICLRGGNKEDVISFGPDVASAGFGAAPLPAGVSAPPLPNTFPLASSVPMPPPVPGAPAPALAPPPPPALPSVPVVPNPGFLTGAVPAVPMAVPAPPAPSRTMLPKAGGVPYENYISGGWTDEILRANGMMV